LKFILLGTGTSQGIPVIGCDCAVCTSKDKKDNRLRVSCYLEDEISKKSILIDIGPDFRQQMLRHKISDLDAVLLTHEHNDHTAGLDDIRSINFLHNKNMPLYGLPRVLNDLKARFRYVFNSSKYPGLPRVELYPTETDFYIGELAIHVIPVTHGRLPIIGFRIRNFAYITDASYISEESLAMLTGLDVLVLNTLRKEKHFSHFNLDEALEQIQIINPKQAYLTHISHAFDTHKNIEDMLPRGISVGYDGLSVSL